MKKRKGIILAGGNATRLYPITLTISKQLLPVFDKPMIYYPLATLMQAEINEILIVSTPKHIAMFRELLGDGSKFGMRFEYAIQEKPIGLADAFCVGEKFIGNDDVALILGDNLIYGSNLKELLKNATKLEEGATIFGYQVANPTSYGVVEIDDKCNAISIEEKPVIPKSDMVVIGLYFYDNDVIKIAKSITPSARGELEITDINKKYMENGKLKVVPLERGYAWFDMGTPEGLLDASDYVKAIETRQGLQIACIEEIAYKNKWIERSKLLEFAKEYSKTNYGNYLLKIANETKINYSW